MSGLFLAMYGDTVNMTDAIFISIFAMIVVFVVLLLISYMIDITAFFINGSRKSKETNSAVESVANTTKVKSTDGGSADVAVIAAAIAAYLGTSVDNIKIQSIRRVSEHHSAWSEKGLLANLN